MEPLTPRALTWRSDEYEEERAAGATTAGGAEAALALRAGLHETLVARSARTSGRCRVPGEGSGASVLRASRAGLIVWLTSVEIFGYRQREKYYPRTPRRRSPSMNS